MGFFHKLFNQCAKPEGFLGKLMIGGMNKNAHVRLADWGMSHLTSISPEEIVEIGCGGGRNAGALLDKYPDAHVMAIDYSPLSVETTKAYNEDAIAAGRITVEQGNVSCLSLEKEHYDLATAFETVYFWPGLIECFEQVASVLKPGGLFLIVNETDGVEKVGKKFEKIIDGMTVYTMEEIEEALKHAGFSGVKTKHHPSKPWIMVLAKK